MDWAEEKRGEEGTCTSIIGIIPHKQTPWESGIVVELLVGGVVETDRGDGGAVYEGYVVEAGACTFSSVLPSIPTFLLQRTIGLGRWGMKGRDVGG